MDTLPFINLPQNQVPELLGGIGDTLISAGKAKQEKKRQAAEMLLKQRDQQRQQQLANAQIANFQSEDKRRTAEEARITAQQHRQEGLDTANAIPHIQALFDAGRVQEAHALAQASGIKLPAVGDKGPAPVAPGPPQLEQGPQVSPEDAQEAAIIRTQRDNPLPADGGDIPGNGEQLRANAAQVEGDRRRFGSGNQTAMAADALAQKNYGDATVAYDKRKPSFSGQSNIGPVTFDPNESDAAEVAQAKKIQDRLAPILSAPGLGKYAGTLGALSKTVHDEASANLFMNMVKKAQEEAAKDEDAATYKQPQTDRLRHELEMERIGRMGARAKAAGAGEQPADPLTTLTRMAQDGATQDVLMAYAASHGINKPVDTVMKLMRDPEKEAEKEVRNPVTGAVHGQANSTRAAAALNEKLVASEAYKSALAALRDHVAANGRIPNKWSDDAIERQRLAADVVARGRKAAELGVSNANIELEKAMAGGAGVGLDFHPLASPESLDKQIAEVDRIANMRVAAGLRPGQRVGDDGNAAPPPTVGARLTGAAKSKGKQKGGDDLDAAKAALARLRGQ